MKNWVFIIGLAVLIMVIVYQTVDDGTAPGTNARSPEVSGQAPVAGADRKTTRADVAADAHWPAYRRTPELSARVAKVPMGDFVPVWRYQSGASIKSGAVVANGRIFIANEKGNICALNLQSGKVVWKKCICEPIRATGLYLKAGGVARIYWGTERGNFVAIDAETGECLYRFKTNGAINGGATYHAGVDGVRVLFGSHDSHLYSLDAVSGEQVYCLETGNYINGTPAQCRNMLYLGGCDGFLRGVDPSSGKELMSLDLGSYIPSSPACSGDEAYLSLHENVVLAVDLVSVAVRWKFEPAGKGEFYSPAAVSDQYVLAANSDGRVYIIDRQTGKLAHALNLSGKLSSEPVVDGENGIVADLDGYVYCFNLATGRQLWRIEHGSGIGAPLTVFAHHLIIGDMDGWATLYRTS